MVSKIIRWIKDTLLSVRWRATAPVLAAAGADVTVTDISRKQLEQDKKVAERDGLTLKTVQGDMSDLSDFEDEYFDIVCKSCF